MTFINAKYYTSALQLAQSAELGIKSKSICMIREYLIRSQLQTSQNVAISGLMQHSSDTKQIYC